jgi:hypothetical protein
MIALVRRWQNEIGDAYVVSLVRLVLGAMLVYSAIRDLHELAQPYFGDAFHLSIVPEMLVPPRGLYVVFVVIELILAVLATIGRAARPALFGSALVGIFLLLCDRVRYHNNRYALLLFALLLSFAPCDRAFVLGQKAAEVGRRGPLWAQRLAQVQLAIIYVASGGSKLLDPDWRSGLVIGDRLSRSIALAVSKGVPVGLMRVLSDPSVAAALSKLAISTELFLAVALFLPRTRIFALWWGVMFHATIEATSKVELFTWLTFTIYALFARPTLRERSLLYDRDRPWGRFMAQTVRLLDWLVRFDVRADKEAARGRAFVVVDRDGVTWAGVGALARVARAIPVFFPISVPLIVATAPFARLRLGAEAA